MRAICSRCTARRQSSRPDGLAPAYPVGVPPPVEELIARDGSACVWCGRELWLRDLTREHVVPRSRGGHMTAENAVVACRACNRRRGYKPVDAYVRELQREGADVDLRALRRALGRLARSSRRIH